MRFGRVITAMVTPFTNDGKVNYDKAQELALHLLDNGSDALILSGTTGESPSLTYDETYSLFQAVKEAVGDKGAVIGGAGSNCTSEIVKHIKDYNKLGLDGYLSVVPYYNKPTQEGIYRHFKTIAEAAESPIIVYNIPGRTGINLLPDTLARIAESPNIVALKESTGNVDQISEMKKKLPADFSIYSGDDYMTLATIAMGGVGVVSVASHLVGKGIQQMIEAYISGRVEEALALHLKLYPIFKGLFCVANPIPVKTALNLLGHEVGGFRLPVCEPSPKEAEVIKNLLIENGLLG